MQNNDVTSIYNELLEKKSIMIDEDLDDYDLEVLCHIIQNKMKREHPLLIFQKTDRLLYII